MGEGHGRAKFSDHDVGLILSLLDARNDAIEVGLAAGMSPSVLAAHLLALQLSYRWIAIKMECSKRYVRDLDKGRVRSLVPHRWKRVPGADSKPVVAQDATCESNT
jgi:hypothetical protein